MKQIHTYSLDQKHEVRVFKTNSPTNYNRFLIVAEKTSPKRNAGLIGTTIKDSDSKEQIKTEGKRLLTRFLNEQNKPIF